MHAPDGVNTVPKANIPFAVNGLIRIFPQMRYEKSQQSITSKQ